MSLINELDQFNDDLLIEVLLYLSLPDLLRMEDEKRVGKILADSRFWRIKIKEISNKRPGKTPRKKYFHLFAKQASMNEVIEMGTVGPKIDDFMSLSLPFRKALSFGAALGGYLEKAKEIVGEKIFPSILLALSLHRDDTTALDELIRKYVGSQKHRYRGYWELCRVIPHDYFTPKITRQVYRYRGEVIMRITGHLINCLFDHQSDDPLLDLIEGFSNEIDPYEILNLLDEAIGRATVKQRVKYCRTRERVIELFTKHPSIDYPQYHAKVMYEIISPRPLTEDDLHQIRNRFPRGGNVGNITGRFYNYIDPTTNRNYLFVIGFTEPDAKFEGGDEEIWGEEDITVQLKPIRWEIVKYYKEEHTQFIGETFDGDD
jgi:hypothetical protein